MNTKSDNPFCGKSVAVTGKLDNYTRDGIKARLSELGAKPVSKVSKTKMSVRTITIPHDLTLRIADLRAC